MTLRFEVTEVKSRDLRPGELFSWSWGPAHWRRVEEEGGLPLADGLSTGAVSVRRAVVAPGNRSVAETIYVRTEAPVPPNDGDVTVYRIRVLADEEPAA